MRPSSKQRERSWPARLVRIALIVTVLALVGAPLWGYMLLVERDALVRHAQPLGPVNASEAMELVKRTRRRVLYSAGRTELTFTQRELEGLAAVAARAVPGLASRIRVAPESVYGAATLELPRTLGYLNLRASVKHSADGALDGQIGIGRVALSGPMLMGLLEGLGAIVFPKGEVGVLLGAVQTLTLEPGRATLVVDASSETRAALREARGRAFEVRDELALLGDPDVIGVYFTRIVELHERFARRGNRSLAAYVGPLFALARERSAGADPAAENTALLLAVATFFGDRRFATFSGLDTSVARRPPQSRSRPGRVTLGRRTDLRLHFVISAGIELLSTRGVSFAVGELKELRDSDGGSGFSFSDLAADRAGVRLAHVATSSAGGARSVQGALAGSTRETDFFPSIDGLVDGIGRDEFLSHYGSVEDPRYLRKVALIDARIDTLPAFARSGTH